MGFRVNYIAMEQLEGVDLLCEAYSLLVAHRLDQGVPAEQIKENLEKEQPSFKTDPLFQKFIGAVIVKEAAKRDIKVPRLACLQAVVKLTGQPCPQFD